MLFVPKGFSLKIISNRLREIKSVKNVHHIHLWQLNDYEIHFEAHVDFNQNLTLTEFEEKLKEINSVLKSEFRITHCVIQPEFDYDDNKSIIVQDF